MEEKITIVGIGTNLIKYDKYDLAGLKLTDEQKDQLNNLGAELNAVINAIKGFSCEEVAERFENLALEFKREISFDEPKKVKTWNKKKFYD